MTKRCTKCGAEKALDEFVREKRRPDGRSSRCLACERARVKAWNATPRGQAYASAYNAGRVVDHAAHYSRYKDPIKLRVRLHREEIRAFVAGLKDNPCMDCGVKFPAVCMDFDHVRGLKSKKVSNLRSRDAILAETAKCDLVCACCHQVRTAQRRAGTENHYRRAFRAQLAALKDQPCLDCGRRVPSVAMDFDHVRGSKEQNISDMSGTRWAPALTAVSAEIAKCDLVCACCHRLRTSSRTTTTRTAAESSFNARG